MAEIKAQYANWREGAATSVEGRWKMVPAVRCWGLVPTVCCWGMGRRALPVWVPVLHGVSAALAGMA